MVITTVEKAEDPDSILGSDYPTNRPIFFTNPTKIETSYILKYLHTEQKYRLSNFTNIANLFIILLVKGNLFRYSIVVARSIYI